MRGAAVRFLTLRAYLQLLRFDFYLLRGDFARLYAAVREFPLRAPLSQHEVSEQVCSAMDLAAIGYFKHVRCLQRSAATTCLLRKCGVPAQMVLGAQLVPFQAHAWVEVEGRVVSDKPYSAELYAILDRC
jgi:hypothetical protein